MNLWRSKSSMPSLAICFMLPGGRLCLVDASGPTCAAATARTRPVVGRWLPTATPSPRLAVPLRSTRGPLAALPPTRHWPATPPAPPHAVGSTTGTVARAVSPAAVRPGPVAPRPDGFLSPGTTPGRQRPRSPRYCTAAATERLPTFAPLRQSSTAAVPPPPPALLRPCSAAPGCTPADAPTVPSPASPG